MTKPCQPSETNNFAAEHAELLLNTFQRLTGKPLIAASHNGLERYKALYDAPYAVLSHNADKDPLLNYSNAAGMHLFELSWEALIQLPSRYTAEPQTQEERNRLLQQVAEKGYIDEYQGVRISANGQRFMVEDAIVWNLVDDLGNYRGQAAVLYQCTPL